MKQSWICCFLRVLIGYKTALNLHSCCHCRGATFKSRFGWLNIAPYRFSWPSPGTSYIFVFLHYFGPNNFLFSSFLFLLPFAALLSSTSILNAAVVTFFFLLFVMQAGMFVRSRRNISTYMYMLYIHIYIPFVPSPFYCALVFFFYTHIYIYIDEMCHLGSLPFITKKSILYIYTHTSDVRVRMDTCTVVTCPHIFFSLDGCRLLLLCFLFFFT